MRAKIRPILEECIELGIWQGYEKAHKHTDEPNECDIFDQIEHYIWLFIDERFDLEPCDKRNICVEVVEGFDNLESKK